MRLKNNIFLWAVPAAVIPLAILGFIATTWSEQVYLREADRELSDHLESVVIGIQRRLRIERDLAAGLARVPEVQQFLPVLQALSEGQVHAQSPARFERVNRFFETFQSVRISLDTVRILDLQGNSLVKVSAGQRSPPVFEGFGGLPYVEDEPEDAGFAEALGELGNDDVGSLLLTGNLVAQGIGDTMPVYNTVTPLTDEDVVVGYLAINPPLLPLNRLLLLTPGAYSSTLLLAEVDSDIERREGLVLFDGARDIDLMRFGSTDLESSHPALSEVGFSQTQGIIESGQDGARIYYQTFLPYPDRLVSWLVALQVRPEVLLAPFHSIRIGIILSVMVALLLSLVLTRMAARQIAGPALNLATGLADFTVGRRGHRVEPAGPDELQMAGRAFNEMVETLETTERERDEAMSAQFRSRRLASLGHMAAGIAHEINNLINTILSLTTLIDRDLPAEAEDARNDVHSIREETERIGSIVHAILNFSREIAGEQTAFGAEAWLRETLAMATQEKRTGDIEIAIDACETCMLHGDRRLLQRVLLNLLENAAHASPQGKGIAVRLARAGDFVAIEVLDEGSGLDEEQRDRAFDPFFTTKPEGVGSGLGLSISLGIVQYHDGSLELKNRPGGGAVARLLLPIGKHQTNTQEGGAMQTPSDS